jgi:hypothetical protein
MVFVEAVGAAVAGSGAASVAIVAVVFKRICWFKRDSKNCDLWENGRMEEVTGPLVQKSSEEWDGKRKGDSRKCLAS